MARRRQAKSSDKGGRTNIDTAGAAAQDGAVADGSPSYPILTEEQLATLRSYGDVHRVSAGELVYQVGEPITDLVLVDSGAIDIISEATAESPEVLITRHHAGRFLGELNMLTGQFSYLTARVSEDAVIHRIPPDRFRRLMAEESELSSIILTAFQARRGLIRTIASHHLEILGSPTSATSMALRTYAERLDVPHLWFDAESVAGVALMTATNVTREELPVVFVPGGEVRNATPALLAERLGLAYRRSDKQADLVIIGGGPAGLAAAVYGASEGLHTVLVDALGPGGQAAASSRIENYLGFPNGLSGGELTSLAAVQALKFGASMYAPCEVIGLDQAADAVSIQVADGTTIEARAVIVATGARYRGLALPNWKQFEGAGIYYAATKLEATACAGMPVTVVGGANSAAQAALFLAGNSCQVDLLIRGSDLGAGMSSYLADRLNASRLIRVRTSTQVSEIHGDAYVEAVTITNSSSGEVVRQACGAIFCFIGATPATSWLDGVDLDDHGFVLTDANLDAAAFAERRGAQGRGPLPFETSAPRIFAAGDVRLGSMKRVAAAVGEGASAVSSVHRAIALSV
ncbi:FAD-dependent oxidoreductase [Diaminobutyricibacter tongyongensis]|uniref:FAD-dependent oxidoreductase n=1 Tax=Leifsonia tongyongensis TaxID=1268043 RepID=A0A6L9XYC4_9MICO|nr:FAD-dependent oxidoreductase [Diaminobutyricibacter tongyongensis]NEN06413.1 FAD-dependent oxidoreductase [Diaminobutyricibacter tongyongensis]